MKFSPRRLLLAGAAALALSLAAQSPSLATPYAQAVYTANGSTAAFAIPFPYISVADLVVTVNNVVTTTYTLTSPSTLTFSAAPGAGAIVEIARATPIVAPKATFHGGALASTDLNANSTQALYGVQEVKDDLTHTVQTAITETGVTLPPVSQRQNTILGFDAGGSLLVYPQTSFTGGGSPPNVPAYGLGAAVATQYGTLQAAADASRWAWAPIGTSSLLSLAGSQPWFDGRPDLYVGSTQAHGQLITDQRYGETTQSVWNPGNNGLNAAAHWGYNFIGNYYYNADSDGLNYTAGTLTAWTAAIGGGYNTSIYKSTYDVTNFVGDYFTAGQHIGIATAFNNYAVGDMAGQSMIITSDGGSPAPGDEGLELGDYAMAQGYTPVLATLAAGSTGAGSVTLNTPTAGKGRYGDGRYLQDNSKGFACASGKTITTIAGSTTVTMTLSASGCPVSTANTTTSAALTLGANSQSATSFNMAVAASSGFTTGVACLADALNYETVTVTAVPDSTHVTALIRKSHGTGAVLGQGGACGAVLTPDADIFGNGVNTTTGVYGYWNVANPVPVSLPIIYSDSTHLYVWSSITGFGTAYTGNMPTTAGASTFNIYPASEVFDISNGGPGPSLTWILFPNTAPWAAGDAVILPPFPYAKQTFGQYYSFRSSPSPNIAPVGFAIRYAGITHGSDAFFQIQNLAPSTIYNGGRGGTYATPIGFKVDGLYNIDLEVVRRPDTSVLEQFRDSSELNADYTMLRWDDIGCADTIQRNFTTTVITLSTNCSAAFYRFSPTNLIAPGTVQATGYLAGGSTGVSCSGAPTAGFATVNGIVTHC